MKNKIDNVKPLLLVGVLLLALIIGIVPVGAALLDQVTFEDGTIGGWEANNGPGKPYGIQVVNGGGQHPEARSGNKMVRFEARKADIGPNTDPHIDIYDRGANAEIGETYWYGFSLYVPDDWQSDPDGGAHLVQWHAADHDDDCNPDEGFTFGGPPLGLKIQNNQWYTRIRWDANKCSDGRRSVQSREDFHGSIDADKGKWTDFVVQIHWSYEGRVNDSPGFIKIWKNGLPMLTDEGPNCYNNPKGPRVSMGVYDRTWQNDPGSSPATVRVVYADEIRIGDSNSSREEVAPRGSNTPTPTPLPTVTPIPSPSPSPSPSPGATLINEGFSRSSDINYISALRGGIWRVIGGELRLTSPAPIPDNGDNGNLAIYSRTFISAGDFTLTTEASVEATSSNRDEFSIAFNVQDTDNYYFASFGERNNNVTSGIFRVRDGTVTELQEITELIIGGEAYAVRVERRGAQIRVFLNDKQVGVATDSKFMDGYVGFGSQNHAASFDNLRVVQ